MRNFLRSFVDWHDRLRSMPLALFLDYDGTLSPIAPTPAEATLSFQIQAFLRMLADVKDVRIAVISGRALSDLRRKVPVKGVLCVGSHGLECAGPAKVSGSVSGKYLVFLRNLKKDLAARTADVPGVLLEDKPFSLAVHFRKTSVAGERKVRRIILDSCGKALDEGRISVLGGKKVIEVLPPDAMDKGRAVERLWHAWGKKKFFPVFIGDDHTDESAFRVLRRRGLTIRVGRSNARSQAEYRLNSVDEVGVLLGKILDLKSSR